MGIGVVLFVWAVFGFTLATIASFVLRRATAFLTGKAALGPRERVIRIAAWFPFLCLCWGGAVFVFQAYVNDTVFRRDSGLGDLWRCPLPKGYALTMIDEPDYASIYMPRAVLNEQEGAIRDVRLLQLTQSYMIGGTRDRRLEFDGGKPPKEGEVDSYFTLETETGQPTWFSSLDELRAALAPLGVEPRLVPVRKIYNQFRFTWFDAFAGALFFLPPLIGLSLLARRILQLRRSADLEPRSA
jgi:hypothetical protein